MKSLLFFLGLALTIVFVPAAANLVFTLPASAACEGRMASFDYDSPVKPDAPPVDRWGDSTVQAKSLSPTTGGSYEELTYRDTVTGAECTP